MANRELRDILPSGELDRLTLGELKVEELIAKVAEAKRIGVRMPEISAVDAVAGTVFYNTDIDKLCFKRPDGFTVKFDMSVI